MSIKASAVRQKTTLELIDPAGHPAAITAVLEYDPAADPFAVSARFDVAGSGVVWTFARDLLLDGLLEPTGDGDVHVWPAEDDEGGPLIALELNSPDGEALLQVRAADVHRFLRQTLASVPRGSESDLLDLDDLLARLLAG